MSAGNSNKRLVKLGPGKRGIIPKTVTKAIAQSRKRVCTKVESPPHQFSSNYESELESDSEEKYEQTEVVYVNPVAHRKCAILLDEDLAMNIFNSIKSLARQVKQLDKKLSVMADEISSINDQLQNLNNYPQPEDVLGHLLPHFPLTTSADFLALEENVKINDDMAQQLTHFFMRTGGKDYGSFLRSNLKAVITDNGASAFSWTGQAGNIKVKTFYIIKLLKEVCHTMFKTTENDMDTTFKVYFNRAKDRLKKAERKANIVKHTDYSLS